MSFLVAILFALTPACQSDADFNCHRPAKDSTHSIIYLFDSENPVELVGENFH